VLHASNPTWSYAEVKEREQLHLLILYSFQGIAKVKSR
jgi:hypothetical protein